MKDIRAKKVRRYLKHLRRNSRLLSMKIMLFRIKVTVAFISRRLIPTITRNRLKSISFDAYYDAIRGDVMKCVYIGFNEEKAEKCLRKLNREKIDTFGISKDILHTIRQEASVLLAETKSLLKPATTTSYIRKLQDYQERNKDVRDYSKEEITSYLMNYFKDTRVDLSKMSAFSVMQCLESMKYGYSE